MKASLASATPASAPRARVQAGWLARAAAARRMAVSSLSIPVQSPSSLAIVRVSESGGSGSASTPISETVVLSPDSFIAQLDLVSRFRSSPALDVRLGSELRNHEGH